MFENKILFRYQAEADLRLNGQRSPGSSQLSHVFMEHSYSLPPARPTAAAPVPAPVPAAVPKPKPSKASKHKEKEKIDKKRRVHKYSKLHEYQNHEREKENIRSDARVENLMRKPMAPPAPPAPPSTEVRYKERDLMTEMAILYEFLTRGIDAEDVEYLRRSYEALLADDSQGYWLNDTHWVDHTITDIPTPAKRRKRDDTRLHVTGSARTEGYYKVDIKEKAKHKVNILVNVILTSRAKKYVRFLIY